MYASGSGESAAMAALTAALSRDSSWCVLAYASTSALDLTGAAVAPMPMAVVPPVRKPTERRVGAYCFVQSRLGTFINDFAATVTQIRHSQSHCECDRDRTLSTQVSSITNSDSARADHAPLALHSATEDRRRRAERHVG